jgi:MEMO1 family protein
LGLKAAYIVPHPPVIIPEVGRTQELRIENTVKAYEEVANQIAEIKPDTIIISSPHADSYYDYLHISSGKLAKGDFRNFGASVELEASYDEAFVKELSEVLDLNDFPAGTLGQKNNNIDHGTMIPLYFIQKKFQNFKLVRISIAGLSLKLHYEFGKLLDKVIEKSSRSIVYIASGDLSHKLKQEGPYGYEKEGPIFDQEVAEAIKDNNLQRLLLFKDKYLNQVAECGLRSFVIMAGVLDAYETDSKLLSYEGPFGVGYLVAAFIPSKRKINMINDNKKTSEDPYVLLAKESLSYYLRNRRILEVPDDLPKELTQEKAGVFVSLKKYGQLRGCIGTTGPTTDSIAEEIIQNAISAGIKDPRFAPVKEKEIKNLSFSVDVLKPAELISSLEELNPKSYGVIVSYQGRSGLLLPNLDGVDEVSDQIEIALKKAGISKESNYKIYRFEVERHEE